MYSELMRMCTPPFPGKAYYRPLLSKRGIEEIPIFLVGINPATPIYPNQITMTEYLKLILSYDAFMDFYKAKRVAEGKTPTSKTRKSINDFIEWLSSKTPVSIAETNIISYPTENLTLLNKEPEEIRSRGKDIFYKLMMHYQPSILILHGKSTVKMLTELLVDKGLIEDLKENEFLNTILKMDYSNNSPLAQFNYHDGKSCTIIAYQHFIYYGPKGRNSTAFRDRIQELLNKSPGA